MITYIPPGSSLQPLAPAFIHPLVPAYTPLGSSLHLPPWYQPTSLPGSSLHSLAPSSLHPLWLLPTPLPWLLPPPHPWHQPTSPQAPAYTPLAQTYITPGTSLNPVGSSLHPTFLAPAYSPLAPAYASSGSCLYPCPGSSLRPPGSNLPPPGSSLHLLAPVCTPLPLALAYIHPVAM